MNSSRRTAIGVGVAAVLVAGAAGGGAAAAVKSLSLSATMTPGKVVTPKNQPWKVPVSVKQARGSLTGKLAPDGRTLTWRLTYGGVAGRVIADVHIGRAGRFGPIIARLCTGCRSGRTGKIKLTRNHRRQFELKNTWVTLITPKYPNGVVRGQITAR